MKETYQLIEGSLTFRDLNAENGFLWCPFGCIERQNDPGILISRLDDGSYDVRLGIGLDDPERFATEGSDWSWMDMAMDFTVDLTFADDMELSDWISNETVATGAAWARCFNPDCGPAGTFTVKPGTYEPILGIYDPVDGCGGTMGTVLDRDFEIDPHDISYTMMEPVRGEWKSDRIDLYTPQDCFGFSDPFGGRIEYSEKKPEIAVAVKPDPVELGHRAAVAASSTAGGRARGAGIRQ